MAVENLFITSAEIEPTVLNFPVRLQGRAGQAQVQMLLRATRNAAFPLLKQFQTL
jgi:hypothetical protein